MNTFNALRECEAARSKAKDVSDAIAKTDWDKALDSYQEVAVILTHLSQSNIVFDNDVKAGIDDSLTRISANCQTIEKAIKQDPGRLSKVKQFAAFNPIDSAISKATFNIERLGQ